MVRRLGTRQARFLRKRADRWEQQPTKALLLYLLGQAIAIAIREYNMHRRVEREVKRREAEKRRKLIDMLGSPVDRQRFFEQFTKAQRARGGRFN